MEDFILGLLMFNKLTAYTINKLIKENYESICSHSIGNVQRALKLLDKKGFVQMNEALQGKVIKKIYEITPSGRRHFMAWINSPMEIYKTKNIEMGKLLMLGYLPHEKRIERINNLLRESQEVLSYMKSIEASINKQQEGYE